MEEHYQRKRIRLPDYDYSAPGYYFITVCTRNHDHLFGRVDPDSEHMMAHTKLSRIGLIVQETIEEIPSHYAAVEVVKHIIMPNHIHLLLSISDDEADRPVLSTIIQQLKRTVSLRVGQSIWQPRYYDHVIRNEKEYQKIWEYIDTNPLRWELDKYYQG
jgi:REP element-mobilizing transposase RayT